MWGPTSPIYMLLDTQIILLMQTKAVEKDIEKEKKKRDPS